MDTVYIRKISIDQANKLSIFSQLPDNYDFKYVYRAAMGATWDIDRECLITQDEIQLNPISCFNLICSAVADEYHKVLKITPETKWEGIPMHIRLQIEALSNDA